jgi:hypothetical protein
MRKQERPTCTRRSVHEDRVLDVAASSLGTAVHYLLVPLCTQVSRSRVLQVDRVQNLRLWTKYIIRRNEVPLVLAVDLSPHGMQSISGVKSFGRCQ